MIYCIYTSTTEVIFREREKRQIEKGRERMKLVEWADALNHLHHFSLSLSHSLSLSLSLSPLTTSSIGFKESPFFSKRPTPTYFSTIDSGKNFPFPEINATATGCRKKRDLLRSQRKFSILIILCSQCCHMYILSMAYHQIVPFALVLIYVFARKVSGFKLCMYIAT
jgi:hypothetical protein